jgi:type I restriction enzyme M protein
VVSNDQIREKGGNLSIPLYVRDSRIAEDRGSYTAGSLTQAIQNWQKSSIELRRSMDGLFEQLKTSTSGVEKPIVSDTKI